MSAAGARQGVPAIDFQQLSAATTTSQQANRTLAAMRRGPTLHLQHRGGRPIWSLSGGQTVQPPSPPSSSAMRPSSRRRRACFPICRAKRWRIEMTEKPNEKPKLELVDPPLSAEDEAALDQDELEYRRLRRDLPGVSGAAAQGIVAMAVSKSRRRTSSSGPTPRFVRTVQLVNIEVGMEKQYFAVDPCMEIPLHGIGISFAEHTLYLTISPRGAIHVIPINCETDNEYNRTKEIGLLDGVKRWVRLYTDRRTRCTRCSRRRQVASTSRNGRR